MLVILGLNFLQELHRRGLVPVHTRSAVLVADVDEALILRVDIVIYKEDIPALNGALIAACEDRETWKNSHVEMGESDLE